MNKYITVIISITLFFLFTSCDRLKPDREAKDTSGTSGIEENKPNLLTDIIPLHEDGDVHALV